MGFAGIGVLLLIALTLAAYIAYGVFLGLASLYRTATKVYRELLAR